MAKRPRAFPREARAKKGARAVEIAAILDAHYGPVGCTLDFADDPWLLLVGGILAAQCTDERVNKILPEFQRRFPTLEAVAGSTQEEMEAVIKTAGLFRNKAKWIRGSAARLLEAYDGRVPESMDELLTLPGVGRKVANLILSDGFGHPAIVVDTHCGRISRHLDLTRAKDPGRVEKDLAMILPESLWTHWGHLMVHHGRELCPAQRPRCMACPVAHLCETGWQTLGPEGLAAQEQAQGNQATESAGDPELTHEAGKEA